MEEKAKMKLQYQIPKISILKLEPVCILAGSTETTPGGWSVDDGGTTGTETTPGVWSVDGG